MYIPIPCDQVAYELSKMDVHPAGQKIMAKKALWYPVRILHVKSPAANIIKQECLAIGAECADEKGTVNCSAEYSDLLLIGRRDHYAYLVRKLSSMAAWFGIQKVIDDLQEFLAPGKPETVLANGRVLSYDKMCVMGILNVTPDSFFAGSRVSSEEALLTKAGRMLQEGAEILDIGGESTRPGADPVTPEEEKRRVISAVKVLQKYYPQAVLSIDTYHAATAEAALDAGAHIINDVTAGTGDAAMLDTCLKYKAPIILMHMRGTPKSMVRAEMKNYHNVVTDVAEYLLKRVDVCLEKGFTKKQMILDPGLGFAKDVDGNLQLCKGLYELTGHGMPVLLAGSRKGFIGHVLGDQPTEERLEGTMALSAAAVYAGAQMVRVHDVKENVRLIRMLEAIQECRK
ncbi:MAG: dihydropteroate synthase [Acidaminococcus sp.]|jgi:dihydropteroate synthase|nr:dihydropteroate synthase [Acidaminococcus sp.]MCI2101139.1 dihydropteroate synthase [Acidaminococcus sp.]MCI2115541.1 dihydropteroate synthase [Acidaminococcus sp.]MCI2117676.1 dihydropteroate synthase [Acidaminococcus sp.]